jgi:hypothetical protein
MKLFYKRTKNELYGSWNLMKKYHINAPLSQQMTTFRVDYNVEALVRGRIDGPIMHTLREGYFNV